LAGFQVTFVDRFWMIAEAHELATGADWDGCLIVVERCDNTLVDAGVLGSTITFNKVVAFELRPSS
jgi:hypothetical protein